MVSVTEVWRKVPGTEHYEASNHGRVRSVDHWATGRNAYGPTRRFWQGKLLKLSRHHSGYLFVKLHGPNKLDFVHKVIAETFIGPANGLVVNHKDANKDNNRPENLEYISGRDNVLHAYGLDLMNVRGTRNGKATLTDDKVRQIRSMSGRHDAIAQSVGCTKAQVTQVKTGRTWKHVI